MKLEFKSVADLIIKTEKIKSANDREITLAMKFLSKNNIEFEDMDLRDKGKSRILVVDMGKLSRDESEKVIKRIKRSTNIVKRIYKELNVEE